MKDKKLSPFTMYQENLENWFKNILVSNVFFAIVCYIVDKISLPFVYKFRVFSQKCWFIQNQFYDK